MRPFPEPPQVPDEQRMRGSMTLRYSDVTQDGRLAVIAIPHGVGPAFWGAFSEDSPLTRAAERQGVVPIMSRLLVEGGEGPLSWRDLLELRGVYQLAHTADAAGSVERLMLNMWLSIHGRRGQPWSPRQQPPGAGEPVLAGRACIEHVFTRPFGPPDQRKVLSFDLPGLPAVPPDRHEWRAPESLLALPEGAEPLDPEPAPEAPTIAFGLDHTDGNQHVNSLVYPQLFLDAALRRLAARGRPTALLCRRLEIAYRKPCFAGEQARVVQQAFARGGALGVAAALVPAAGAARPYACAQLLFEP